MAYLNLYLLFPKKTEKIKANISPQLRQRLIKEEVEKVGPILKAQELAKEKVRCKNQSKIESTVIVSESAPMAEVTEPEPETEMLIIISPVKIANLRARRLSCEDSAVASIQAIIRGRKCRRMTMSLALNGDSEYGGSVSSKSPDRNIATSSYRETVCSPSLVSRAPFGAASPSKNGCAPMGTVDKTGSKSFKIENEDSILGLLKVKTTMMMNYLNEQLIIIENMENEKKLPFESCAIDNPRNSLAENRDKFLKLVEKSLSISSQEVNVNEEFQRRMIKLLQ